MNLHLGDALCWLRSLAAGSVDCVITDPPYDSMEKYRSSSASPRSTCRLAKSRQSSSEWFGTVDASYLGECLVEFGRILKPGRHCYVFTNHETLFDLRAQWPGSLQWHKPLVWDKRSIGMGYHYRAQYELIVFGSAGRGTSQRLRDLGTPDVLSFRALRAGRGPAYYPTEKPVELLSVLVSQSCVPGELVIDPFFGSGSTAMAAELHGCAFAGCDVAPAAHAYLAKRQTESKRQLEIEVK